MGARTTVIIGMGGENAQLPTANEHNPSTQQQRDCRQKNQSSRRQPKPSGVGGLHISVIVSKRRARRKSKVCFKPGTRPYACALARNGVQMSAFPPKSILSSHATETRDRAINQRGPSSGCGESSLIVEACSSISAASDNGCGNTVLIMATVTRRVEQANRG
jgi:hypothetical protein